MTGKHLILAAPLLLAGCAALPDPALRNASQDQAAADPFLASDDPLSSAAALLIAAEASPDAATRAPFVERLNALGLKPADDEAENPLGQWRLAHAPYAGTPYRGRTLGPAYRRARLAPGQSIAIGQVFYAGRRAEMRAQTSGSTIALAVSNPRAQAVCEAQLSSQARCQWLPLFTERFAITLENRGTVAASVYLVFE